jgi:hypothetical protein
MKKGILFPTNDNFGKDIMVETSGEFRPPKAGEWYISGAIPAGYYTKNNLSTAYNIAQRVRVKKVVLIKVLERF